jgi:hypothetical protein
MSRWMKGVEDTNFSAGLDKLIDYVRTDETCASRDKDPHA